MNPWAVARRPGGAGCKTGGKAHDDDCGGSLHADHA
jgi:hypothetical protein